MVRQPAPEDGFDIHVDPSCLSTPMDEDVPPSREDTPKAVQDEAPQPPPAEETTPVNYKSPSAEDSTTPEAPATPANEPSVEQLLQETVDHLQSQQNTAAVAPLNLASQPGDSGQEDTLVSVQDEPTQLEEASDSLLSAEDQPIEGDSSPRSFSPSGRRISGRTDALIQAAARAVVDQIERQRQEDMEPYGRDSVMSSAINDRSYTEGTEMSYTEGTDLSYITETDRETEEYDSRRESYLSEYEPGNSERRESDVLSRTTTEQQDPEDPSRRESRVSQSLASVSERRDSDTPSLPKTEPEADDRGGDSSSHHDADSEVFSERSHSARSSLGSFEDNRSQRDEDAKRKLVQHADDDAMTQHTRSPRISDFSQYDREEFVPTIRGTRPPFRTPSDVRAIQMSSPPPSVFAGSPRSSKRHHVPTISRLGSPAGSAQYSPKGRTTPSRLKPRKVTPPLVLLHATILPLRWPWGDVLEDAPSDTLTPEAKSLREAWRFLHDRLGDTVCERGILLPHPQGDYEVLEERLLDALELPLRRRARILQCGHYIGPANESTLTEDMDSEIEGDDFYRRSMSRQSSSVMSSTRSSTGTLGGRPTHWCGTCNHEIQFEALGPGKVFRVKIYASNGLMKAGAWEACWKEMERVDVEIEPIINGADLQDELEGLATKQREDAERAADEEEAAHAAAELNESILEEDTYVVEHQLPPASPPVADDLPTSPSPGSSISRHDQVEERRARDEDRMREIYGDDTPAATSSVPVPSEDTEAASHQPYPHQSPESPSEEARARREARRSGGVNATLQNASLPELLLEAVRVFLLDRKNVALVLLSCLVLFLAIKPAARDDAHLREWDGAFVNQDLDAVVAKVPKMESHVEPKKSVGEPEVISITSSSDAVESIPTREPCEPKVEVAEEPQQANDRKMDAKQEKVAQVVLEEPLTSREVVRVVETVTETQTVKAYVTESAASSLEEEIFEEPVASPEVHNELVQADAEETVPEAAQEDIDLSLEPEIVAPIEEKLSAPVALQEEDQSAVPGLSETEPISKVDEVEEVGGAEREL